MPRMPRDVPVVRHLCSPPITTAREELSLVKESPTDERSTCLGRENKMHGEDDMLYVVVVVVVVVVV